MFGNNNWATSIQGTTPDYLKIRDLSMLSGRAFTDEDVAGAAKVALLGKTVANNLFGDADPVGQIIRIKNVPFTVVGELVPKGQSPSGQDQDDVILIPISTAKRKVTGTSQANARSVGTLMVQAIGPQAMSAARSGDSAAAAPAPPPAATIRTTTSRCATWRKSSPRRKARRA